MGQYYSLSRHPGILRAAVERRAEPRIPGEGHFGDGEMKTWSELVVSLGEALSVGPLLPGKPSWWLCVSALDPLHGWGFALFFSCTSYGVKNKFIQKSFVLENIPSKGYHLQEDTFFLYLWRKTNLKSCLSNWIPTPPSLILNEKVTPSSLQPLSPGNNNLFYDTWCTKLCLSRDWCSVVRVSVP